MPLAVLNTAIATTDGAYHLRTITLDEAKALLAERGGTVNSAVGHQATADILSALLGAEVPVNRQQYAQSEGETALVFKLNGRAPEGVVLDRDEVEKIGYTLKALSRSSGGNPVAWTEVETWLENNAGETVLRWTAKGDLRGLDTAAQAYLWAVNSITAATRGPQRLRRRRLLRTLRNGCGEAHIYADPADPRARSWHVLPHPAEDGPDNAVASLIQSEAARRRGAGRGMRIARVERAN